MESGFLKHLQFLNVTEAVGVIEESGIGSGRNTAAHSLIVVHEPEPYLVEIPPRDFIRRCPVVIEGAMVVAVWLVVLH